MRNFFLWAALLWTINLQAQLQQQRCDSLMQQLDDYQQAMISVCLRKNNVPLYNRSIGWANMEAGIKSDSLTLYGIGSVSKMFTAVMIYQLFEEKKLHPNTTLNHYFPQLRHADKISIAQLLNHSSGIHNFTDDSVYWSFYDQVQTNKSYIAYLNTLPSDFEPGSKNEYSNTNYVLLSMIIEFAGKAPYEKQLTERICNRLALKHTYYGKWSEGKTPETQSYKWNAQWVVEKRTHPSVPRGAGAITSTPNDLCVFIEGLMQGKLLNKASLQQMLTLTAGYGNGIFQIPFYSMKGWGHTGSIDGFESTLTYFEKEKLSMCILGNAYRYSMNDIAIGLLSIWLNRPYTIPNLAPIQYSEAILRSKAGVYKNNQVGLSITIRVDKDTVFAQGEGQPEITLQALNDSEYIFPTAQLKIIFHVNAQQHYRSFTLIQNGMNILFER